MVDFFFLTFLRDFVRSDQLNFDHQFVVNVFQALLYEEEFYHRLSNT